MRDETTVNTRDKPAGLTIRSETTQGPDWIDAYRAELDGYRTQLCHLDELDPAEVFMTLSGMAARAAEIRAQVYRVNSQRATAFRQREVDPFLEQTDFQFKVWSRIQATREMEFRISGGTT